MSVDLGSHATSVLCSHVRLIVDWKGHRWDESTKNEEERKWLKYVGLQISTQATRLVEQIVLQ